MNFIFCKLKKPHKTRISFSAYTTVYLEPDACPQAIKDDSENYINYVNERHAILAAASTYYEPDPPDPNNSEEIRGRGPMMYDDFPEDIV